MEKTKRFSPTNAALIMALAVIMPACLSAQAGPRQVISLDGQWRIAEGSMDEVPKDFDRKIPVPGLADMAEPAFEEVGFKSDKRQAFWYRRTFKLKTNVLEVAILKINKAKYGTKVLLNGKVVGEHLPCFTPALLDVKEFLKGGGEENELVIRVGAGRGAIPEGRPAGWDFEKYKYIPGIYDSVELILTGRPYIVNVQAVPDIAAGKVRVVTELQAGSDLANTAVSYEIRPAKGGDAVGEAKLSDIPLKPGRTTKLDVVIPIKDCRLWSPEDPFLYELKVDSGRDALSVRFGMRSFRFDRETGRAVLNGKTYFMRGTNVCVYRFFEDDDRGDKPWRKEWVRRLHRKFKSMNWNSIRYCIGFPPELWYEIADEEGFLIQDEFPIWLLGKAPEKPVAEKIVPEYTEWMRDRWNHPCVVIWDGQNESVTVETGKAIGAVRHMDLSDRPWENGWAPPQKSTDFVEAHPYLFIKGWQGKEGFRFKDMANVSGVPHLREAQKKLNVPIIINEYAWLWLTRDGEPTCLTDKVYAGLLGPDSTVQQRRVLYAKYLAALTEFWRCHRECAGVLHFCGLGYSRPGDKPRPEGGATSDHFIDLEKLEFEPYFERFVRDAFSPVGLMVDSWDAQMKVGVKETVRVFVINDLHQPWKGLVRLRLMNQGGKVFDQLQPCVLKPLEKKILSFEGLVTDKPGRYMLLAELLGQSTRVSSFRDITFVEADK